jgi:hypothetical protein
LSDHRGHRPRPRTLLPQGTHPTRRNGFWFEPCIYRLTVRCSGTVSRSRSAVLYGVLLAAGRRRGNYFHSRCQPLFSGYRDPRRAQNWVARDQLLGAWQGAWGGKDARTAYVRFVEAGIEDPPRPPFRQAVGGWILGSEGFVARLRKLAGTTVSKTPIPEERRLARSRRETNPRCRGGLLRSRTRIACEGLSARHSFWAGWIISLSARYLFWAVWRRRLSARHLFRRRKKGGIAALCPPFLLRYVSLFCPPFRYVPLFNALILWHAACSTLG